MLMPKDMSDAVIESAAIVTFMHYAPQHSVTPTLYMDPHFVGDLL